MGNCQLYRVDEVVRKKYFSRRERDRPVNFFLYQIFPETIYFFLVIHKVCKSVNDLESEADCLIQRTNLTGQVVQFIKQTVNVHINKLQTCT